MANSGRSGSGTSNNKKTTAQGGRSTGRGSGQRAYVGNARDNAQAKRAAKAGGASRSTGSSSSGRTGSGSRSSAGKSSRNGKTAPEEQLTLRLERDDSLRDEITVIVMLAVGILMVLSYLHICGSFGEIINKVVFGLTGWFGYAFPFVLVFVTVFAVANKRNNSIVLKTVYFACMMVFVSALIQLAAGGFDSKLKLLSYFTNSVPGYAEADKTYGGLFGGIICKLLCPVMGNVAAAVVMVAAVIVFFLLIVGKALFTALAKKSIESAEQRRQRRLDEYEEYEEYSERYRDEYDADRRERSGGTSGRGRQTAEAFDYDDGIDDSFFDEDSRKKEKKEKKGNFVDSLMRMGMGLEVDRIADTPEYNKLKETYGTVDYEMSEISAEQGSDSSKNAETEEAEDIVTRELNKKFANKQGIDVVKLHEHPTVTKTGITRTYMVDEEEPNSEPLKQEDSVSNITSFEKLREQKQEVPRETEQQPEPETQKSNLKERSSSGATSFTTPEQLAALREEQENKPEPPYVFPPISLLTKGQAPVKTQAGSTELQETVDKLQKTFESFGVGVTVTDATIGPTVTRYELLPDQGVKVKTITSLADDIKLALAAAEIRIEAPIPGKAAVGIEVPNSKTSPVLLRDLLEAGEFKDAQSNLTFAVGKDIGGKTICFDIAGMPHMLIAGATGSGKSVCINALILSILYKAKPSDVKMIMIDPKRVELIGYNGIPHLLVPVVTDVKKATGALNWAIAEMDDRYERFANAGVNNLKSYNRLMEEKYYEEGNEGDCPDRLPQILIIVDELNDLMMTANSKEVEASICRLTQLARASGIHVVLATQRPSVNVITGTIKANIPSRIAFSVSSIVDSRTIIDQAGAEKLLGKGDMLFYPQGYPKPVRLQGAYVSDREISDVVDFIKSKCKEVKYNESVSKHIDKNSAGEAKSGSGAGAVSSGAQEDDADNHDEFFEQAGRFIIEKQKASIGMLQRVYKIGFNRAARIMDQLAEEGVVGPEEGTKPRRILMTLQQFDAYISGSESGGQVQDDVQPQENEE